MAQLALIIDDSRAMRAILSGILEELDFDVIQAGDGQKALETLEHTPDVDVALVDWNLPIMSGLDFVREVRSRPRWNALRLMMVTTETELSRISQALDAGANEYIMKPFTKEMLLDKLAMIGFEASS